MPVPAAYDGSSPPPSRARIGSIGSDDTAVETRLPKRSADFLFSPHIASDFLVVFEGKQCTINTQNVLQFALVAAPHASGAKRKADARMTKKRFKYIIEGCNLFISPVSSFEVFFLCLFVVVVVVVKHWGLF